MTLDPTLYETFTKNHSTMPEPLPIPSPPGLPIFGNTREVDPELPVRSFMHLHELHGPIYRLSFAGVPRYFIASHELMNEVCDEKRFSKHIAAALQEVRNGVHDGLFTALGPEERNWGIAHRILAPAFGPLSIRGMFDEMHDIASQLVMKWARHGPDHVIPTSDDFTRLTLDTLALTAMNFRFNSYYHEEMHPFIDAMGAFLRESGDRSRRPAVTQMFYREAQRKYEEDIALLRKTSDDVIKARRSHPSDRKDLLNAMLNGRDPKTGEGMTDDSITDNMITFLIAGHETTSGLLSFAFYYLLKNPAAYQKAQQEVDSVIGKDPINVDHLSKLPFINAILRETLRVWPTAPMISFTPKKDELLAGKYQIPKGEAIVAVLPTIQRDPLVWGEDAAEWKPERMLDAEFERVQKEHPNCWKPFGNGMRGCVGRPFAWQEALLVVAMLLQNFNFSMSDPAYTLGIKQTLTVKPKGFNMRAQLRNQVTPTSLERSLASASLNPPAALPTKGRSSGAAKKPSINGKPLAIYYGSNTGTCEALAQRLAGDAPSYGFQAQVGTLDSAKENLSSDKPVVIVTASYEGQPPDNAGHFFSWLESLKDSEMDKVSYAVFGCGHQDWAQTFHKIPKAIDDMLEQRGGQRIVEMGKANAAAGDMFTDFETWEDQVFWPAMTKKYGASDLPEGESFDASLNIEVSAPRASTLRQDVMEARVVDTKVLSTPEVPEKRHIEISLPSDQAYSSGDYLAILPLNPKENVHRAMRYFGLPWDSMLTISTAHPTTLPTDLPIPAADVFGAYIELAQPASKRNLLALAELTKDEATKAELKRLSGPEFTTEISTKRVSLLDLLERFPSVTLPLGPFLQMLPPMRVRQYSISSSPLWNPSHVTLTYAVLDQPALSGQGRHVGVASSYLSKLETGDKLHVSVRPSHQAFHLPKDAEKVPVICIAAGTGIAPFRGFIQERAAQLGAGRPLAPALLFYGCHSATTDDLYPAEFARWEAMGAVSVRRAYSRAPAETNNCKYVQDRLWADRREVVELFDQGAKVFVCGSRGVGEAVGVAARKMWLERARELGKERGEGDAERWFEGIRNERYATDVFA
ncbi:bifunctional P-450/NADPH-P450 reductase [Mytilinidion resinicola]|uniref:Bifunctional cytochrome P450/NADPH--P450 reductase n=1 Tax=Mytilinidion resinicola TaxID=574789 RepID=A0A6A6YXV2_9PEZI|nr:bifunctional P-450/NADPH-P450 reductase [Mytilinidion resinicola]KAF2813329.1 bifunctional P-450/NADPH-P450 reductase [Mytilinidion resinicola]